MTAPSIVTPWQGEPYARSAAVLTFALTGTPVPQGSKSYKGQSRVGRAILIESSKSLKPWRLEVQKAIEVAMRVATPPAGWPLIGPVAIDLIFTVPKPKSAPKTRRTWPIVKPDVDKLARAALDAATFAGAIGDDAQVVELRAWKVYPAETPRALRVAGVVGTVHVVDPDVSRSVMLPELF